MISMIVGKCDISLSTGATFGYLIKKNGLK